MKKFLIILLSLLAAVSFFSSAQAALDSEGVTVDAVVLSTEDFTDPENDSCEGVNGQKIKIRVVSSEYLNGKEYTLENTYENDYYKQAKELKQGDKVRMILYISEEGWVDYFYILNRDIYYHGIWLAGLFFGLLLIIGRKKGLKSAVSLILTLVTVIFIMIPLIKNGNPPVTVTILCSIAMTIVTMLIVGGFGGKSFAAILGTLGGLLAAWVLSAFVAKSGNMTAITTAEVELLMYNDLGIVYNLQGILLSGIIIGCLGAIMDVAMSISSSVHQINEANSNLTTFNLFQSGMEVGCDIIGTMANTLVLAYTGSALTMILVQSTYNINIIDLLNHDFIFVEVLRTMAGSIGMILTVPFTAFLSSVLVKRHKQKKSEELAKADDNQ